MEYSAANVKSETKQVEILIIEDNCIDIRMMQEVFQDAQPTVNITVMTDGQKAMEFLFNGDDDNRVQRPDLILLDLNLPKKDGRELLKKIKNDDNFRDIPVIVFTTSDLDTDIVSSYTNYANCYITKPIEFDDFQAALRAVRDFWLYRVKLPSR